MRRGYRRHLQPRSSVPQPIPGQKYWFDPSTDSLIQRQDAARLSRISSAVLVQMKGLGIVDESGGDEENMVGVSEQANRSRIAGQCRPPAGSADPRSL